MKTNIVLLALLFFLTAGCDKSTQGNEKYPDYVAPEQRKLQILNYWGKVQVGMNTEQVKQFLGNADEVRPVYDSYGPFSQEVGFSYWYILERREYKGSRYGKEALVRVIFDKSNVVKKIDKWGF
jgi:outer membrane protein assembly factor BamE (lipoprotein component of BamABCDE complex)